MSNLTPATRQPLDFFAEMRKEMQDVFGNFFGRQPLAPAASAWPPADKIFTPLDVKESESEFVVQMDIPGVTEKDIKVTCQADVLTIKGERKEEKTEGKGDTRYSERSYGMFTRSFSLPAHVNQDAIRAQYKDGVLNVHVPKMQKTPAREIKVSTPQT